MKNGHFIILYISLALINDFPLLSKLKGPLTENLESRNKEKLGRQRYVRIGVTQYDHEDPWPQLRYVDELFIINVRNIS